MRLVQLLSREMVDEPPEKLSAFVIETIVTEQFMLISYVLCDDKQSYRKENWGDEFCIGKYHREKKN